MYQATTEQHRKIVAAIVAAAARLPKSHAQRATRKRFLQAYYANVDAEDIAARDPPALAGAALVAPDVRAPAPRPRPGAGVQPDRARARLHLAAHRHRDGERRHALPRRFHRPRADAALAHPAFPGASRSSRLRATAPASCAASRSAPRPPQRQPAPRVVSARRSRSHRRSRGAAILARADRAQHARRARGVRRLGQDARGRAARPRDESEFLERALRSARCERGAVRCSPGWRTGTSPFWAIANTGCSSRKGQDALDPVEATGLGHPAPRPQTPAEHQPHAGRATSAAKAARATSCSSPRRTCNPRCIAPAISTTSASSTSTPRAG